ncbi:MAG: acyloxyacyl hydrolase [Prolixibacteraceae bacterium]
MKKFYQICLGLVVSTALLPFSVDAQHNRLDSIIQKNRIKTELRFDYGNVMPTNDFVKSQNSDLDGLAHFYSYSFRIARQTTGDQLWQQLYRYPEFGMGVYSANYFNTKMLGHPIAVYGFFNAPFFQIKKFSLNYELGLGLTFNWNHYDPVVNPGNVAISTDRSVYIDAGVNLKYPVGKRINLGLGYGFTHFSNGHLKLPNKGLNTGASKISLSYDLFDDPIQYQDQVKPKYKRHYEWIISGYFGMQNTIYLGTDVDVVTAMKGINLPVFGINNTFNRQVSYKSKVGFGFNVGYNGSQSSQVIVESGKLDEQETAFNRHLSLSVFPSYELVIDKLSVLIQPGVYVYRQKTTNMTSRFYQRIGVKYHFSKDLFAGINLRATEFYISDFIEWTIGHRLNW